MRAVKIVLKVKNRDNAQMEKSQLMFRNEVEILRKLDHPNIVKLFEVYEDDSKFYMVQE